MPAEKETTLKDVMESVERLNRTMKEVAKWTKFQSVSRLRETLVRELNTPQKKMTYELTDGNHSRREIAEELQITDDSVRSWWDKWHELALVEESETRKGRPQRVISLDEVGIEVPKPKPKTSPAASVLQPDQGAQPQGENLGQQG